MSNGRNRLSRRGHNKSTGWAVRQNDAIDIVSIDLQNCLCSMERADYKTVSRYDLGESMCIWGRDRKAHGNIVASGKWVGGMVTISAFLFGLYLL